MVSPLVPVSRVRWGVGLWWWWVRGSPLVLSSSLFPSLFLSRGRGVGAGSLFRPRRPYSLVTFRSRWGGSPECREARRNRLGEPSRSLGLSCLLPPRSSAGPSGSGRGPGSRSVGGSLVLVLFPRRPTRTGGHHRPVLKHGPRSSTATQVGGLPCPVREAKAILVLPPSPSKDSRPPTNWPLGVSW